jgi:DNA modification methylase
VESFSLGSPTPADLLALVPPALLALVKEHGHQKAMPLIARSPEFSDMVEDAARTVPSQHRGLLADSRFLDTLPNESVHLVITSPPYWNNKPYESGTGQLGLIADYEEFLGALDQVWAHCLRVLVPGGRLIVVVGDVLIPRRRLGRHVVFPLHSSIQEHCRTIGFDNLAPIIWYKIGNAALEVENGGRFLGKPYEPNGIVKNDIEYILFQRKPGGYRSPHLAARLLSIIPSARHSEWFQQVWDIGGASTRNHPAPFPVGMIERLVRMFSFVGDTVLDPFLGSGTTSVAAAMWGRNSIGVEVEAKYFEYSEQRIARELAHRRLPLGG